MNNHFQQPLAERMRPTHLDNYIGQEHLVGKGSVLYDAIQNKSFPSCIFWGTPGIGKTTLAFIISSELGLPFYALSAISAGVKDLRAIIAKTEEEGKILLFIDEIHRFNKSQQDALLGAVEQGKILLIGATTENPSFEVIHALLSRCQVYVLEPLSKDHLMAILKNAIESDEFLKEKNIDLKETDALLYHSGGDARKLLNVLELCINSSSDDKIVVTNELVQRQVQQKSAMYDKSGEMHYDVISAFIKSIRGSDPNGALYWLGRMIHGGEDPVFIARRMLVLSSEDIGLANPTALVMATSCFQAVQMIGFPECRIILSQTVIYLATSPKSNSSYMAIEKALEISKSQMDLPVPLHLRNAPTKLMKELNYGADYQYAHNFEGNFVPLDFLPDQLRGTQIFEPGNNARENEIRKQLQSWWKEKYKY